MLLELKDVSKAFGGNRVISGLTLSLPEGQISSFVGPNGAGKTTIFNLVTGFLNPDSGTIKFANEKLNGLTPQKIKKKGVVRTFQGLRLFLNMTVYENVLVTVETSSTKRHLRKSRREFTKTILDKVRLWNHRDVKAQDLSYAEKKFLSLARVMATDATCLLLDEPASGLDGPSLELFHELVQGVQAEGKTVLLIEHNLDIVRAVSDRIFFLNEGNVAASGTPDEIFSQSSLGQLYFGV